MKGRSVFARLALVGLLAAAVPALAQPGPPEAPQAPPPPQTEVVPPHPGGPVVWRPGHWQWNGRWVWVAGHYAAVPRPGAVWVAGHWMQGPYGRWRWVEGRWQ